MEEFIKWQEDIDFDEPLFVDRIISDNKGLVINLSNAGKKNKLIKLQFDDIVYSYNATDESYTPDFWIDRVEKYFPFYYSYNSEASRLFKKKMNILQKIKLFILLLSLWEIYRRNMAK